MTGTPATFRFRSNSGLPREKRGSSTSPAGCKSGRKTMLIEDIEYVIFRHPDFEAARHSCSEYGLLDLERRGDQRLFAHPWRRALLVCDERGEAAFVGIGFRVAISKRSEAFRRDSNAQIADCPHPGGGLYVVGERSGRASAGIRFRRGRLAPGSFGGAPIAWNDAFPKTASAASSVQPMAPRISASWPCRPVHDRRRRSHRLVLRQCWALSPRS